MRDDSLRHIALRPDVRLRIQGDHAYVCSSDGALRVERLGASSDSSPGPAASGTPGASAPERSPLDELPAAAVAELAERRMVYQAGPDDDDLEHLPPVSFLTVPAEPVQVAGEGDLPALIAHQLGRAGVNVLHCRDPVDRPTWQCVIPFDTDQADLLRWTDFAIQWRLPVVTYAASPSRLLLAVLQPPLTPCPLCLSQRIRANFGWQEIADLPLGTLLGTVEDTRWPGIAAGGSLVVEAALRSPPTPDDGAPPVVRELNTATLTATDHPLLRIPFCEGCGAHHAAARLAAESSQDAGNGMAQLARAWTSMQRAVDPLTGIVGRVEAATCDDDAGYMTHALTVGKISTKWFSPVAAPARGGAVKIDPLHAKVSALSEAFERYACGVYDPSRLIRASLRELGSAAIDPQALPLGSSREYKNVAGRLSPYHPDKVIDWVRARSLPSGAIRYLPACSVYVPYRFPRRDEVLLRPISTGLGAGTSDAQSIRAGLLEVIERDSLAITWYNRLPVPTLLLDALPDGPARTIYRGLRAAGVELICKLTTTDVEIPSVLLSSRQRLPDGQLIVAHSARADLDLIGAIKGGLEELVQTRKVIREWITEYGVPPFGGPLKEMEDFFAYYCEEKRLPMLDFLREGDTRPVARVSTNAIPESYQHAVDEIVRRLADRGYETIVVDITPIDVAECGVKVSRVVIPGMQPISFSLDFRYLGGRRVFDAPVAMGLRDHPFDEDELNRDPLPAG